jgi:hypothetical protein
VKISDVKQDAAARHTSIYIDSTGFGRMGPSSGTHDSLNGPIRPKHIVIYMKHRLEVMFHQSSTKCCIYKAVLYIYYIQDVPG